MVLAGACPEEGKRLRVGLSLPPGPPAAPRSCDAGSFQFFRHSMRLERVIHQAADGPPGQQGAQHMGQGVQISGRHGKRPRIGNSQARVRRQRGSVPPRRPAAAKDNL